MTPKEKAKQLVDRMHLINSIKIAKKCALIAVDEIINELVKLSNGEFTFIIEVEYWQEVKQEIGNL